MPSRAGDAASVRGLWRAGANRIVVRLAFNTSAPGMQRRAVALGGTLSIASNGAGTTVRLWLPTGAAA